MCKTQKVRLMKIRNNVQFEIARQKIDVSLKTQLIKSAKRFTGCLRVHLSRVNQRRYRNHYRCSKYKYTIERLEYI